MGQEAHGVEARVGPEAWDGGLGRRHEGGWRKRSVRWQRGVDGTASEGINPKDGTGAFLQLMDGVPPTITAQDLLLDVDQV